MFSSLVIKINQRIREMRESTPKFDLTSHLLSEILYHIVSLFIERPIIWLAGEYWRPWPTYLTKINQTELFSVNTRLRTLVR